MPLIAPNFNFAHQRLPGIDIEQFSDSFSRLPIDPHIEGNYRLRRYSRFTGHPSNLKQLEHSSFMQSKRFNHTYGDIDRAFEPLEDRVIQLPQFEQLLQTVASFYGYDPYLTTVGVHQIRITASHDETGLPVPEGIHKDGFDLIAICCINRIGISGANTSLFQTPEGAPLYNCTMTPGDIIYCNDRRMYHYTSPLQLRVVA